MNAERKQEGGIVVLAVANSVNSAFLAFTSSISPVRRHGRAGSDRSGPRPGEHQQVVGEHPESNPPLHSAGTSITASAQAVTAFECADASFAAGTPAQSRACRARARLTRLPWQHHVPDPAVVRGALVAPRREAAVGHGQLRGA